MSTYLLGRNGVIVFKGQKVAWGTGFTISLDADLIKEYKLGSDKPALIASGNKTFGWSFDAIFISKQYAQELLNATTFTVIGCPAGTAAGKEKFKIQNSVLTSWELTVDQDGVIMESAEGEGLTCDIITNVV